MLSLSEPGLAPAQWGIGPHSDFGLFTMLVTDAPGLEIQHPATKTWHQIPFQEYAVVMNVGDVLDRLSSGRYLSPFHRARNLSCTHHRLSLPFFYDPSWDCKMVQLPVS